MIPIRTDYISVACLVLLIQDHVCLAFPGNSGKGRSINTEHSDSLAAPDSSVKLEMKDSCSKHTRISRAAGFLSGNTGGKTGMHFQGPRKDLGCCCCFGILQQPKGLCAQGWEKDICRQI